MFFVSESMKMELSFFKISILLLCFVTFEVNGIYFIDDSRGLGRRFDGIGGISGGGATSKLLINYPEPQRSHILDYLFKPNFGASLHILKVEIGGDGQSTDGSEASHMHNSWDENYSRGYEWWLMVEAKKRNPNIRIYGLPWSFPGWLNPKGKRDPYEYANLTAGYVIKWIKGAKIHYNVTVDYIGIWNENHYDKNYIKIWNEKNYDIHYIKTLRHELDKADLHHVKIVAPDAPHINDWKICPDILSDPELAAAIEAVGCHYPGTITTPDAIRTGKPLWASEDYSTKNDIVGGGCWARILNQNYVNGNITATISWNLIAAYYDTLPYTRDGLMTAECPWSGHYSVDSPIWMAAHTTQFTEVGWRYYHHGYGSGHLEHGGSYVSLTSPDDTHLTIVIETMSHDHSKCIRPPLPAFNVSKQQATFTIKGKHSSVESLYMWRSQLQFDGKPSSLFKKQQPIKVINGSFTLTLNIDEVITLTSVATGTKGSHSQPPPAKDFPLPYVEDFEKYNEHEEAPNFAQQTGSFEVVDVGGYHSNVMRQMVTQIPIYWCSSEKLNMATNVIGNQKWTDIYVQVEACLGSVNGSSGYFVGARIYKGGCLLPETTGIFLFVYPHTETYRLTADIAGKQILSQGSTGTMQATGWNVVRLLVLDGVVSGAVNDVVLFNQSAPSVPGKEHGFVGLGTTSWGVADYDKVMILEPRIGQGIMEGLQGGQEVAKDGIPEGQKQAKEGKQEIKEAQMGKQEMITDSKEIKRGRQDETLRFLAHHVT